LQHGSDEDDDENGEAEEELVKGLYHALRYVSPSLRTLGHSTSPGSTSSVALLSPRTWTWTAARFAVSSGGEGPVSRSQVRFSFSQGELRTSSEQTSFDFLHLPCCNRVTTFSTAAAPLLTLGHSTSPGSTSSVALLSSGTFLLLSGRASHLIGANEF
jgi:hypothetical protein